MIKKSSQADDVDSALNRALRETPFAPGGRFEIEAAGLEVLSAIPAWLLIVDRSLVVRFANRSFLEARGLDPEDVSDRHLSDVLLPRLKDGAQVLRTVERALDSAQRLTLPALMLEPDGGFEGAVDFQATPVSVAGEPCGLLIMHDVSEHWWSRELILHEKKKLEEIVDGMGASLAVLDHELRVVWANRTFREWFGEMWGKRFELALRGLLLKGEIEPEQIFTEREHVSRTWSHYTETSEKRYYRNLILAVRDTGGALQEIVLVTQDLTEVTLRAEQHQLLRDLANLMQSTLDLDRLLYVVLTCATEGHALGFNRAFIFLLDSDRRTLAGRMGVGPESQEEAFSIWAELAGAQKSLAELTSDDSLYLSVKDRPLNHMIRELAFPVDGASAEREIVVRTAVEDRVQIVESAWDDPRISPEFRQRYGAEEFVSVPLRSKGRVVGVLVADNAFSRRKITPQQVGILELFAAGAGLAVDNALTYDELRGSLDRLKEAQEALIQSERLATVGRLAAHIAHEIRNPLVTIGGHARSILDHVENREATEESAEIIYEEVLRLEQILRGVMDFSRPVQHEAFEQNLNEVAFRVAETMQLELVERGIEVEVDLDPDLPLCSLDERRILQVLTNLLRNGAESMASLPVEEERRLTVRTHHSEEAVHLDVSDTGPGVPEDVLHDIFEPFVSRKVGGTGLGLATVRMIMLDHGGTVDLSSNPGGGATFTISLPRSPVTPPHLEVAAENGGVLEAGGGPR